MRIGSSLLLKDNYFYQSYAWDLKRPLGSLATVIASLDELEVDEISIVRPIRKKDSMENLLKEISELSEISSSTPISFGGGLRSISCIKYLKKLPVERFIFSSSFISPNKDSKRLLEACEDNFGRQATIALLPFKKRANEFLFFCCRENKYYQTSQVDFNFIDQKANEVIFFNTEAEGFAGSFDFGVLDLDLIEEHRVIISGGISQEQVPFIAREKDLAAIYLDNSTLYRESSISLMKKKI